MFRILAGTYIVNLLSGQTPVSISDVLMWYHGYFNAAVEEKNDWVFITFILILTWDYLAKYCKL